MIGYHNHEGYADPTAYAALNNVIQENRFIYICSPYRGSPRVNIMRARHYCRFAVSKGRIPLAPHLYFPQFMSDVTERDKAMEMNLELLKLCSEIWVFGSEISEGMAWEISKAEKLKKKIRCFNTSGEEVPR
ncbi:MAG: DUF4406 domain-containing protein [Selenomonas sp.]|nr:DUF4406 domain-containing protein [Selenomonas sp.]